MNNFATLLDTKFCDELPDQAKVYTARLAGASKRMDRLLLDLLEYGRVSSAGFQVACINTEEVILKLVERIRRSPLGCAADIQLELPLPMLQANGPLLEQALENLVTNALKFTAPITRPCLRIRAEDHGNKTRVCVEDNGPGIVPQYHQLIFGAFQRLDQSDLKSTGIGLAIVRAAVERMKGSVGVDSVAGKGSRFWIELPKARRT
jgi:signal transduction histidine kinase